MEISHSSGNKGPSIARFALCLATGEGSQTGGIAPEGEAGLALSQAEFNRFVSEHGATLYRVAYRMVGNPHDAEDIVQDAYRSAWKSRLTYKPGLGERAWLVSILRRRTVDRWRKRRLPMVSNGEAPLEISVEAKDPTDDHFSDEVQAALTLLNDDLRETLLLVVVAELTHQEAADELGIPIGTVLSRVSRARKRLREILLSAMK